MRIKLQQISFYLLFPSLWGVSSDFLPQTPGIDTISTSIANKETRSSGVQILTVV